MTTAQSEHQGTRWVDIASEFAAGIKVLEAIALELRLSGFDDRQVGLAELAFTEALINAIRHGNQDDPNKRLVIEYSVGEIGFQLSIEDEGTGFTPAEVDDPTTPENLVRSGGRGLMLIRSFAHRVEFNPRGNRITIGLARTTSRAA
jgi:serine/threonine-protein kinase RsbW